MREMVKGGSIAFVLKIVGAALSFLFYMLVTRQLGASGAGVFFIALSVITPIAILSRFGMDSSLIRFIAAHAESLEWAKVRGVMRHALRLAGLASLGTVVILGSTAGWLSEEVFNKPELSWPLRYMALAMIPMVFSALFASALQGLKQIRDSILTLSVLPSLLAIPLLFLLTPIWHINGVVFSYLIGVLLTCTYAFGAWQQRIQKTPVSQAVFPLHTLLSSCIPILGVTMLQQLMAVLPTFILGIWGTSAEVGIFSAAMRTAGLVSLVLIAGNSILAPKFSVLFKKGDMQTLDRVARQGATLMSLMAMPVILLFLTAPRWVMGWFGNEFVDGATMLVIVALGQLVNVMTGSVGILLIMTGKERELFKVSLLALLIGLILSLWLIPLHGGLGAAIATSISVAVINLMRVYSVWRTMGIMTLPILRISK